MKPDEKSQQGSWRIFFRVLPKISSFIFIDSQWKIWSQRQFSADFFLTGRICWFIRRRKVIFNLYNTSCFFSLRENPIKNGIIVALSIIQPRMKHISRKHGSSQAWRKKHTFFCNLLNENQESKEKKRRFRFAATAPAPHEYHQLPQGTKASNQSHHHH